MSKKQYLDYEGLKELVRNIDKKYAPIAALVFKQTVADIASLPSLVNQKAGWMYNVTQGGITTSSFAEGAGHVLSSGENVVCIEILTGTYTEVPSVDITDEKNPSVLGWYVQSSGSEYALSVDITPQNGVTYYTADSVKKWDNIGGIFDLEDRLKFGDTFPSTPENGDTFLYMGADTFEYTEITDPEGRPSVLGWYELVSEEYVESQDQTIDSGKTYYTKDSVYKSGVIYKYNSSTSSWVAKSGGISEEMVPITSTEIDDLFI